MKILEESFAGGFDSGYQTICNSSFFLIFQCDIKYFSIERFSTDSNPCITYQGRNHFTAFKGI